MFENLRNAFREALDNFNKELDRDQVPGAVDRLLAGMHDELADAKVRIKELEDQIARADVEAAREKKEAETARRVAARNLLAAPPPAHRCPIPSGTGRGGRTSRPRRAR